MNEALCTLITAGCDKREGVFLFGAVDSVSTLLGKLLSAQEALKVALVYFRRFGERSNHIDLHLYRYQQR